MGATFGILGRGVAYGTFDGNSDNQLWVAVGYYDVPGQLNAGNILNSDDAKNWEVSDSSGASFTGLGNAAAYGTSNGTSQLWVAIGDNTADGGAAVGNILYSEDGKTWTQSDSTGAAFGGFGIGIAYGTSDGNSDNQLWVAAGSNSSYAGNILWSNDGKTWEVSDSSGASFGYYGNNVAYGTSRRH